MKKILLITHDFYPSIGGIAQYWRFFGNEIPAEKWVVLAPPLKESQKELDVSYRIYRRPFTWQFFPRWLPLLFQIPSIISICKKERIEIIIDSHLVSAGIVALIIKWIYGIPYIIFSHGMDSAIPLHTILKKYLVSYIVRNAEWLVANSRATAKNLLSLGGSENNIRIMYPCPSLLSFRSQIHDELSKELLTDLSGKRIILTISRLVERKGISYVIDALPEILRSYPNVVYVVIGEGPHQITLQKQAEKQGVSKNIYFMGALEGVVIRQWIERCDIFIMTPFTLKNGNMEGFGIVFLEANSCGKPVIGSRCGGIPDAVIDGETGILVDEKNSAQIVHAAIELLSDNELSKRLGENGKKRVEQEFQWKMRTEKIKSLFD